MVDSEILADAKIVVIALEDPFYLGILSSRIHVKWAMKSGGWLGVGNDATYNHSECFYKFPFPDCKESNKAQIRKIAVSIDTHRKQRQALNANLNITEMYNVMEQLRGGENLNAKEKKIYEDGVLAVLLQLHDELDIAVADAYGWSGNLSEEEILEKLVDLNKKRFIEEARGFVRWLRPEYQKGTGSQQAELNVNNNEEIITATVLELSDWPKTLSEQAKAVNRIVQQSQVPQTALHINKQFKTTKKPTLKERKNQIENLLETISSLGLVRKTAEGLFVK